MTNAVTSTPFYSYANLLNPSLSSPSSASNFPDPSTALSDAISSADTADSSSTDSSAASSAADSLSSPQLPADVVTLLQQFLSPSTSDPAASLLDSSGSSDPLSALLDVSSYNGVLNAAYASAPQAQTQSTDPVQNLLSNYETAINAYNNANSAATGQDIQATLGNASQSSGTGGTFSA